MSFDALQKLLDKKRLPMKRNAFFESAGRVVSLTEMTVGTGLRTVLMRADEFEPGSYVIQRNPDNTLTLLAFEREGGCDPLTAQQIINCLPTYDPVFIQFGAQCANDNDLDEEENSYKEVVVKFDTQEAFDTCDGDGFDTVYRAFQAGLPGSWMCDDALEPVGEASDKMDCVRYNGGMKPELIKVPAKRKRTVEKAK